MPRTQRSREIEFAENTIAAAGHAADVLNGLFERTRGRQLPAELIVVARDLATIIQSARRRRQEIGAAAFVETVTSPIDTGAPHGNLEIRNGPDA